MVNSVKLESGSIKFKNCFKPIAVPFKIYADTECNLEKIHINNRGKNTSYILKNIKIIFLIVLLINLYVFMINLANQLFFTEEKNTVYKLVEAILEEYEYCKENFNKNLIMSGEDEEKFQSSNKCWICNKLFTEEDKKVRGHDHIIGTYRGSTHSNCNIILKLTEKVPLIFHNLRGSDSHWIMQEINKFDVEISVIPNGSEKYMAFTNL